MHPALLRLFRRAALSILVLLLSVPDLAAASVTHLVDAMDALYFTDWGHPYDIEPFLNNEFSALGRGEPAEVVSNDSGAFDFAGSSSLAVTATGANAINSSTLHGPDGIASLFRALPVYSLIGVWSISALEIDPVGSAFFVGSATLAVPGTPSAYLWLGFNDGIFEDNLDQPSPGFSVTLTPTPAPEASTVLFLLTGLGLAGSVTRSRPTRRRR